MLANREIASTDPASTAGGDTHSALGTWTGVIEAETLEALVGSIAEMVGGSVWIVDAFGALVIEARQGEQSCPDDCEAARARLTESVLGRSRQMASASEETFASCGCGARIVAAAVPDTDGVAGAVVVRFTRKWEEKGGAIEDSHRIITNVAGVLGALWQRTWELRQRVDELKAMYRVSAMLAGRTKLQEILDLSTRSLVEVMGLRGSSLRLVDEETGELKEASIANLSQTYLEKGPLSVETSPVDREAIAGKTVYIADLPNDPRTVYKEAARREGLVSGLVTALSWRGKGIGVLRAYTDQPHKFTAFEESLMKAIASQAASAIVNARLRNEMREAERLERQVKLAADVQRRMIPARAPVQRHYRFGCVYEPSHELCGDFYDFLEFDSGDVGLVIADVVGKGVAASLMMASARSALRSHAKRVYHVDELMDELNQRMCHDTLESEFITLCYGVLSADGRRLTYCNAGHEPPLLLRDGVVTALDVNGTVLGIDPEATFTRSILELRPGDLLLFHTDGLIEASNFDFESFGRERLQESFRLHGSMPVDMPMEVIAKQLLWDVRRFAGLSAMADDITLVVARVV